jgi:uncharacterized membrane protein YhaH (DUF805 family)
MTFGESISKCLSNYANFEGRATRPEYWWFMLFTFLLQAGGSIISEMLAGLIGLALLLPSLAAGARRLHDVGRSGWWLLIGFIPLIGLLVLIYWCVQPGTAGANEYGEPPAPSGQA